MLKFSHKQKISQQIDRKKQCVLLYEMILRNANEFLLAQHNENVRIVYPVTVIHSHIHCHCHCHLEK